jgi:DNA-binding LacI/PurR family transcriptional regulator
MITNSDHLYRLEKQFLSAVSRRPVDGVIAVPIHLTHHDIDQFVRQTHTPMAVLGQQIQHPQVDVVYGDDESAIYATTNWLINQQGYKQIGFVGVPEDLPPGPRRFHGFERAMRDLNLPILEQHIVESDFTLEGGKRAAHKLINAGDLPDVLIVLNDLMAIGVILALQDAGYVVPDDVAVVGFDNIQESTIIRPSLTTIAQDPYDIGGHLSRLLFERIEDNTIPARRIETKLKLIQRNSA